MTNALTKALDVAYQHASLMQLDSKAKDKIIFDLRQELKRKNLFISAMSKLLGPRAKEVYYYWKGETPSLEHLEYVDAHYHDGPDELAGEEVAQNLKGLYKI